MLTIKTLRRVALAEAVSFLILLVAAYVKRAHDEPVGVSIMGPVHGLLFVAYVLVVLQVREDTKWPPKTTGLILLGAVLPFGGFVVDRWLAREHPETA